MLITMDRLKLWKTVKIKVLAFSLMPCLFMVLSCKEGREYSGADKINDFLLQKKTGAPLRLVLDTITSFEWDELIVVGPYTDLKEISDNIAYDFGKLPQYTKHHDTHIMLGFIQKKEGVQHLELGRLLMPDTLYKGGRRNYRIYPRDSSNFWIP